EGEAPVGPDVVVGTALGPVRTQRWPVNRLDGGVDADILPEERYSFRHQRQLGSRSRGEGFDGDVETVFIPRLLEQFAGLFRIIRIRLDARPGRDRSITRGDTGLTVEQFIDD